MNPLLFLLLTVMVLQSADTAKRLDDAQRKYQNSLNQMSRREQCLKLVGDQIGKKYYHMMNFAMNCMDVLQVVEKFLSPRDALGMKSTSEKLKNLQITGKLSLFPKANNVQVFRDMNFFPPKNEITWEDPENLISNAHKENLEKCLRLAENERPNCVFDEVSQWDPIPRYIPYRLYPFFKEILFAVLNAVDGERRRRGNKILLRLAIRFDAPEDVARVIRDLNLEENISLRFNPLQLAVLSRRIEIVKILLEAGAKADTVFHSAAVNGNVETLRSLLDAGADVNAREEREACTPLIAAAMTGKVENVKFLLQRGARIDYQNNVGRSALMNAAERGWIEVVQELLSMGANTKQTDVIGKTAAQIAEENLRPNCAEEIITFENAALN